MKKLIISLIVAVGLVGCASTQKSSDQKFGDQDRQRIKSVKINNNISKPPKLSYYGKETFTGNLLGQMFGAVGGAINYSISNHPEEGLQKTAEKNGIYVEKIVFQELNAALRTSGKLSVYDTQEASDAIINVSITGYGYSQIDELGSKVAPTIAIKCEMVDNNGKVVWSANGNFPTIENPAEPISVEETQGNPKVLENAWRSASKTLAQSIVSGL